HQLCVTAVSKVFRGDPVIAQAYLDAGICRIGDSRVANLKRMAQLSAEKWLIRPPMLSEVAELVRYADVSLNSELAVLRAINDAAQSEGKTHKIILMADLGDIREGYVNYDELLDVAEQVEAMDSVELYGIGTNLTCFSFVQSDPKKMQTLASLGRKVEQRVGHPLEIVSGGNSATIDLMLRGGICEGVNNLRLGESLLFGRERSKYRFLPGTFCDAFTLECEIVELKEKPSLPWGEIGVDSYGKSPTFVDRGMRIKAVCALGKQDFDVETTTPLDAGIQILGTSSDHLMLDITDSEQLYQVGDIVRLRLGYFSTMRAFTSEYVEKVYQNEQN
ncbi:MAG: alanine/ornithine racemase family PLP-dependent enzyme, partial [Pygmaiobacter sp.]